MGKFLVTVAVAMFALWLALTIIVTAFHTLVNLLWIIITVALGVWLFRTLTRRNRAW